MSCCLFPLRLKDDTTSQPVKPWKKSIPLVFSGPVADTSSWIWIHLLCSPLPNATHIFSRPVAARDGIKDKAITTVSVSFLSPRWLPWRETALFVGKVIWKNNMPKARKPSNVTESDVGDTEVMVLRFVELLKDEGVLKTLRSALYPQALSDKLDKLTETIAGLTSQLEHK